MRFFLQGTNWNLALKNEQNPPDVFLVNSLRGDIRLENIERKTKIPEGDTVPGFKGIGRVLLIMTESLDLPTDEMERSNGVVQMTFADTKRSVWSGIGMERILFIQSREAGIGRSILGYSSWLLDDKIAIKYGVDGQLLDFSAHWPSIEPVRTNKLLTIDAMIDKIKQNQALTDSIDFPGGDVKTVTLKDIEIQYFYHPPSNYRGMTPAKTDMYPIAAILVTFKAKNGQTEDAGIYLPILESQR